MADFLKVWTVVVMCSIGVGAGIMTAKGFYCRDPNTGKLYPVNTTWPSTTFCGSYTCKLRKRNITEAEYKPLRQMNITGDLNITDIKYNLQELSTSLNEEIEKFGTFSDLKHISDITNEVANSTDLISNNNKTQADIEPTLHKEDIDDKLVNNEFVRNIVQQKIKNIDLTAATKDGDRYLTEDEIKSLTELLHAVKKSDIEAIVEMYNLAQDVYKEIDSETDEKLIEETINDLKEGNLNPMENVVGEPNNNNRRTSYWYEPLAVPNKHKTHDIPELEESKVTVSGEETGNPKAVAVAAKDMTFEDSKVAPITLPGFSNPHPYFRGALNHDDFRKLPYYYYPISNFQRLSSYVNAPKYAVPKTVKTQHSMPQNAVPPNSIPQNAIAQKGIPETGIPHHNLPQNNIPQNIVTQHSSQHEPKHKCKHGYKNMQYLLPQPSWFNRIVKKPFNVESQRKAQPTYLPMEQDHRTKPVAQMPYPINYPQNINVTYPYPNQNLYENPWTILNLYNRHHHHHVPSYLSAAYIAHIPNAILVNPTLVADKKEIENIPVAITKTVKEESKLPDWQTDSLPSSVLEEVKANILSKSKLLPLSLRKKIKLEKVGKVLKLDEFARPKREANHKGEVGDRDSVEIYGIYEVYLDKSTRCDADTEPGFFRMGNVTQPYPACCPQRISRRST